MGVCETCHGPWCWLGGRGRQGVQIHLQVIISTNDQEGPLPAHYHQVASRSQGKSPWDAWCDVLFYTEKVWREEMPAHRIKSQDKRSEIQCQQETARLGGEVVVLEFRSYFTLQTESQNKTGESLTAS